MNNWRSDFPIFSQKIDRPFIYFDNAATTQKPQVVLEAMQQFYAHHNANIHRGLYGVAENATSQYEAVRAQVARFLNAASSQEIIFTHGTTDSINTVALIWARHAIQAGDEIVISMLEHHSNFVPWQELAREKNALLKIIPVTPEGDLDYNAAQKLITARTKLVAVTHVSNALGIYIDVQRIVHMAKKVTAKVLIDGAQAVGFEPIDVQKLNCDFYVFSGHKILGPMGVGVLYIKQAVQSECRPYKFGGGMVHEVTSSTTSYLPAPHCFEPGTPAVAQVIGLGAALSYIQYVGIEVIQAHVAQLVAYCKAELKLIQGVTVLPATKTDSNSTHIVSFIIKGIHSHDVAAALNAAGICVRAGHHCAQPLADALGYPAFVRLSFHLYNTQEEVAYFLQVLQKIIEA